ncbi:DUF4173 domain-containing protein [Micromonospora sp. NBC_01655]|uniref:DUF4153 domain-containing protein n=1 Tax=Micromonospora sp. NBC_01655 TaxID=2975983 RepID=UPI00224FF6A2|nr:DUF4173 domain-containing protein [Micromonospora sp. NBC_01655]MCX4469308.1 DUF4173 domain-containing protein [Micromonospora sp. NBC_01655]
MPDKSDKSADVPQHESMIEGGVAVASGQQVVAGGGGQVASGVPRPGVPPRPPSFFERRWPGPNGPARPVVLGAVAVAAVVAAFSVPFDRPGLGWLVAVLAATAALVPAGTGRRDPAPGGSTHGPVPDPPPGPISSPETTVRTAARPDATGAPGRAAGRAPERLVWATATIALVSVGYVRAAGWLFVLCLLAAVVTGVLAVAGGRTPLGMLTAASITPAAPFRALSWAGRGLPRSGPGGSTVGRGLATVAASVALLLVFGLLFSSADAVFADLVTDLLPEVSVGATVGWLFRCALIGAGLLGAAYLLAAPADLDGLRAAPARPVRRLEWVVPLALLDALFAAFVLVQLTVLFGGSAHVLRTAGLSYAQYARGGFWQLLAVSALTLLVIAGTARWAPRTTRADRLLFRLLLGTLTALSLVVVASALYRMQVYADAYGATRLRLVVAAVELWLGALFVLVGVAVVRLRAGWLPPLVVGTAVLALLGLAAVNPDRLIAERNVDRYRLTGMIDVEYVSRLSADAVPALDRLPEPLRSCALRDIAFELPIDHVRTANLGRAAARELLGSAPTGATALTCPTPRYR